MALRGKKPGSIQKRLKAFFYGVSGVGKTTAAIQFPAPYVIDTERGAENAQYTNIIEKSNGAIFQTSNFDEIIDEIKALLSEKHHYKTLVIDPLTTVYFDLVESCTEKLRKRSKDGKDGTEMGRNYAEASKCMKRLFNLLARLDMNVIITSHAKAEYGAKMEVIGQTFDCYKKMDYFVDLCVEVSKVGKDRFGVVKSTRIDSFEEGERFKFSYEEISEKYGRDVIEKEPESQKIATKEQVDEIKSLIHMADISDDVVSNWFVKSGADCFEDMEYKIIQKCINGIKKRFEPK